MYRRSLLLFISSNNKLTTLLYHTTSLEVAYILLADVAFFLHSKLHKKLLHFLYFALVNTLCNALHPKKVLPAKPRIGMCWTVQIFRFSNRPSHAAIAFEECNRSFKAVFARPKEQDQQRRAGNQSGDTFNRSNYGGGMSMQFGSYPSQQSSQPPLSTFNRSE